MKTVRIIGGGKFGMKAARALSAHADILLIDKDEAVCQQAIKTGVDAICADGVDYLTKHLKKDDPVMIVPSVPLHLAYQWVKQKLEPEFILQPIEFPKQILSVLPNPMIGKQGEIYLSYAEFICPDNCPEPAEICTHTGKPRPGTLYKLLESLSCEDFQSVVVRSRQIAPGLGGYESAVLFAALESVRNSTKPVLFSTACRCHGVIHSFVIKPCNAVC
ncbi:MAG: hypothetical protein BWK80_62450 [Desulfobacteraceae bacterium IS3]|nr:MAG: hypothetical protein BWK80_62450 [Desulfobacteraceae bacterium IS3]